jgi:hypothetical protein
VHAPISRSHQVPPAARLAVLGLSFVCLAAGLLACGSATRTPRPSPSLIVLDFSPRPSTTAGPSPAPRPSVATWPLGWDESFCTMFAQAIDAQQLLVDVQLDIQDGNNHDARLLADELINSAKGATASIATLPAWTDAQSTVTAIGGLMDLGSRAASEYHAWFADGKAAALRRARDLRTQDGGQVPDVNTDLAALAAKGLACQDTPLVLEAPK